MGHADDGGFGHRIELVDERFHLLWIDVVATGNDQIPRPPDDRQPPFGIHDAQVAGDEIAVGAEFLGGLLGLAPVALEDVLAAHLDAAHFARWQRLAPLPCDPGFHARQGEAHSARNPVAMQRVGGVDDGLRHAVALQNAVPGSGLPSVEGSLRQRCGAADEHPHPTAVPAVEVRILQQAGVEGRHAHHHRGFGEVLLDCPHIETGQENRRGTAQQGAVQGDEQAMHMEQRQGVQQHVVVPPAPTPAQGFGIGANVVVGQHRALGAARGAGGVNQGGQVIAIALGHVKAGLGRVHGLHEASTVAAQRQHGPATLLIRRVRAHRIPHEQPRFRVSKKVRHFSGSVSRIERHIDTSCLKSCQVQGHGLGHLANLGKHPVTRRHASFNKHRGQAGSSLGQIGVGPQSPIGHAQGGPSPAGRENSLQIRGEIAVH